MTFALINWPAVLAGTVLAFLFGWLIYSPRMFGRRWAEGSGIDPEPPESLPLVPMALQLVALFLLALIVGLTETAEAIGAALLAILAAAAMVTANGAFSGKNGFALAVDGGFVIGAGVLMIAAQGIL